MSGNGDVAVSGTAQRRQNAQQCRLAGAVRPDDSHELAGPDIQIDAAQGHEGAELFGQGVNNDQ